MQHKQLKYGRVERERRFLLDQVPDLSKADRVYDIVDRYIRGTRLRLRRMEQLGGEVAYKLARKLPPHAPGAGVMGNLYLDEGEHALLEALPADVIRKRRTMLGDWGVDVFEGPLAGLVLAEAEADDDEALAALVPPFPVVREVTGDPRFSGGRLATATPNEVARARSSAPERSPGPSRWV